MTSKQALNVLLYYATSDDSGFETMKDYANQIEKDLETLEQYKNIEKELGIDLIEAKYVIDNANMTVGYTRDGKPIHTDYGYIEDFITELREALKNDK